MAETVYILCAATSLACAGLLFRQYRRRPGSLLFWSTGAFICLALANLLLFVDLILLPNVDLAVLRGSATLIGMAMMLYGLIRENT